MTETEETVLAEALTMTGLKTAAELIDMANVGQSLMERIADLIKQDGPFKGWMPADDPAEIVFDLVNHYEDAALSRAPEAEELGGSTRMTSPASRSQTPLSAGWQDISSAPTMEAVLVYGGEVKYPVVASWTGLNDEPWTLDALGNVHDEIDRPTHWMPLPEPPAENGLSGAQQSELTRLAQDGPLSPPSTGGEGEDWDRIPRAKRFGRRLNESAVKHLAPGTLLRFYSEDPWFDPSPSSPANGDIVIFTGAVSNTFPKVGPHLEVRTLGGRVYPGGGWVYQIFQFVADPSPEMGEWRPEVRAFADLMEAQLRANDHKPGWKDDTDLDLFERLGQESAELLAALRRNAKRLMWGDSWVMEDTVPRVGAEAADVANFAMMIADVCGALKLKENGLSREELGGSARASRGAAGPSDCAEGDARLSDGGRG